MSFVIVKGVRAIIDLRNHRILDVEGHVHIPSELAEPTGWQPGVNP